MSEYIYVTVDHLDDFRCLSDLRTADRLIIKKDHDDPYDDEALSVYDLNGLRCGYVANSVATVARGTYSAGRLYDRIGEEASAVICFILNDSLIARLDPGKSINDAK